MSDRVAMIGIPVVALVCCLGLPLVLGAGVGAFVWIVGAALPLVVLAAVRTWASRGERPARRRKVNTQ